MAGSFEDYQALFESAPEAMYTHDASGTLTHVNKAFEEFTGYPRAFAVGRSLLEFVAPEHHVVAARVIGENGHVPKRCEVALLRPDGQRLWCEITAGSLYRQGHYQGKQGAARQLPASHTEHTRAQLIEKTNELARFSRHLQLLHQVSTTSHPDLESLFASYLSAGTEIFGVSCGAITQQAGNGYIARATHGTEEIDRHAARVAALGRTLTCSEIVDSGCPYAYYIGTPIFVNDQLYGNIGFWSVEEPEPLHPQSKEIIELMAKSIGVAINQRNLTDLLAHQARHDALTGLPNRLLLRDNLDAALDKARQSGSMVAVVFIDLDRFKQINDTLGHSIGDGLLQQIAWRLENCLTRHDHLARMGGDEFTAILTGLTDADQAVRNVRQFLAAVRKPCRVEGYELFVTASIGISFFPRDGRDAATLLRNADSAMYAAKASGKNDLFCFTAETSNAAMERLEIETSLRRAIEKEELRLLYQPQVELGGRLAGIEILLDWEHPVLGHVSPGQFIPVAEESGLILSIGTWVLRQACRKMSEWQNAGYDPVPVSVNVSPLQFAQSNFVSTVAGVLTETGANPNWLMLEITESLVMRDIEQSARRMSELRALGVKIAIDDFGTGYSSLSYLRTLPVDVLKIDRSFLHEVDHGAATLPLIQTIVVLAHNMGLTVTAEGVETIEQLDIVRRAGCDRLQGHMFGAPLQAEAVEEMLKRPHRMVKGSGVKFRL